MASVVRADNRSRTWKASSEGSSSYVENDKENQPRNRQPRGGARGGNMSKTLHPSFLDAAKSVESSHTSQHQPCGQQVGPAKTPSSASTLRRALRATIRSPPPFALQERQLHTLRPKATTLDCGKENQSSSINPQKQRHDSVSSSDHMQQHRQQQRSHLQQPHRSVTAGRPELARRGRGADSTTARVGSGALARNVSSLGPPQRVAPKTPNSILRTELEAFDSSSASSSCTGEESLLLSPPPGALWNVLRLVDSGCKSELMTASSPAQVGTAPSDEMILIHGNLGTDDGSLADDGCCNGLVVVSPQAAGQIHRWSTSSKSARSTFVTGNNEPTRGTGAACGDDTLSSPAVHRALLQTPHQFAGVHEETSSPCAVHKEVKDDCHVPQGLSSTSTTNSALFARPLTRSKESSSTLLIQRTTKCGVSMDFSSLFSPTAKPCDDTPAFASTLSHPQHKNAMTQAENSLLTPATRRSIKDTFRNTHSNVNTTRSKDKSNGADSTDLSSKVLTLDRPSSPLSNMDIHQATTSAEINLRVFKRIPDVQFEETNALAACENAAESSTFHLDMHTRSRSKNVNCLIDSKFEEIKTHSGGLAFEISSTCASIEKRNATTIHNSTQVVLATKCKDDAEVWVEKQSRSFLAWVNHTLNTSDDEDALNDVHAGSAKTDPISGLRSLLVHRRLSQVRTKAYRLFQDASFLSIRTRLLQEIAVGRLSIRSDRDVTADVHLRQKLTSLLLSYTTPWLRMGLEVMFGECIDCEPKSDPSKGPKTYHGRLKLALESFIRKRLLSDSKILEKYTKGRCNVPSGVFETRYKAQMRTFVLSRIMVLVFFLDRAKDANILDNIPRLFTVASDLKSSRDVLLAICRECLSSEGDVIKHFSRIGLSVSYTQHPVDEVDFRVSNIATDFRDGVLLTRLAEIVAETPYKSFLNSLRLPAVSRLQKKFNVTLAISKIKNLGIVVAESVKPHHITDGHRDKVLTLMWCIIAHCCMAKLLKGEQIEQEIRDVIRSTKARLKFDDGQRFQPLNDLTAYFQPGSYGESTPDEILKSLLLRWSQAICFSYGLHVRDFTDSFADGRVFCCLIHYYYPSSIPRGQILATRKSSEDSSGASVVTDGQSIENERLNWEKVNKFIQDLGGIPCLISGSNSTTPPDEKSILLCLSYLCSRLMESSKDIFAAILIQTCYRKHRSTILREKKNAAAEFIFQYWCLHKLNYFRARKRRFEAAVAVLENFILSNKGGLIRMRLARLDRQRQRNATVEIQRVFRGKLGRTMYLHLRIHAQAAILVQVAVRRFLSKKFVHSLLYQRRAATVIQSIFRRFYVSKYFLYCRKCVILLQRYMRGRLTRKHGKALEDAVLVIQHSWWMYVTKNNMISAATLLQKNWRGILGRNLCEERKVEMCAARMIQKIWKGYYQSLVFAYSVQSIVRMQACIRGFQARKMVLVSRNRQAAISIQRIWRGFLSQVQFQMVVFDVICIQNVVRRHLAYGIRNKRIKAVVSIQCGIRITMACRRLTLKKELKKMEEGRHSAAVLIQSIARVKAAVRALNKKSSAATMIQLRWRIFSLNKSKTACAKQIQALYRSRHARLLFVASKTASINIQRCWRGNQLRQAIAEQHFAACVLQSKWRQSRARTRFLAFANSVVILQARIRRASARSRIGVLHYSAIVIQTTWKRFVWVTLSEASATKIQRSYRMKSCRASFLRARSSVRIIQRGYRIYATTKMLRVAAAVLIQKTWRSFSQQVKFQMDVFDIVCVQSVVRRCLTRRDRQTWEVAALVIQYAFKCAMARQQLVVRRRQWSVAVHSSAVKIQSLVRAGTSRSCFIALKTASASIQKWWRGEALRKCLGHLSSASIIIQRHWRTHHRFAMICRTMLEGKSSQLIQSIVRSFLAKRGFQRVVKSAMIMQCAFRRSIAKNSFSAALEVKRKEIVRHFAAVSIQALVRRKIVLRKISILFESARRVQFQWRKYVLKRWRRVSATKIQTLLRLYQARIHFKELQVSAENIQRCWRGRRARQLLNTLSIAAITIQSNWRRFSTHSKYLLGLLENNSALLVQATFRMYLERMDYLVVKFATVTIQRYARGFLTCIDIEVKQFAATEIQRLWRGFRTPSMRMMVDSAILIQSIVRMGKSLRGVKMLRIVLWAEFCFYRRKACVIQHSYRQFVRNKKEDLAARIIQGSFRFYSQLRRIQLVSRGMIQLQALLRGVHVRRKRSKRLVHVARRTKEHAQRAIENPSMRLGNRTDRALYVLETSQSLTKIMEAVKELEASTRLSVVCCQVFTKANAANILLHLIQSCNRSVPHMELKEYILLTLENVAQYPSLVGSFAHYKYAEVFLDNVQVFRDKDGIFCLAVTLLGRISKADPAVAEFCATHEHLKRLKEVYRVVGRRRLQHQAMLPLSNCDQRPWKSRGLQKQDEFDRDASIKTLGEMIEAFTSTSANPAFKF